MRRDQRVKLVRILGMLGSDHAGERAAAALAADRLVKATGITWPALLIPKAAGPRATAASPAATVWVDPFTDYRAAAESRLRQVRDENERLVQQVARLKRQLDARNKKPNSARKV